MLVHTNGFRVRDVVLQVVLSGFGERRVGRQLEDLDAVGLHLMPSVFAMRVLAMPSPAIGKALARVTTRYDVVALCAYLVRVFRSPRLNSNGAAGWFIRAGVLRGPLNVNIVQRRTTWVLIGSRAVRNLGD